MTSPESFHERFDIQIDITTAKKRFVNRAKNIIFDEFLWKIPNVDPSPIFRNIANALGEKYDEYYTIDGYIQNDFYKCLQAIEAFYNAVRREMAKEGITFRVKRILKESEVDLVIKWENGQFIRSGAKLLDQKLVNEPLHWLSKPKYKNVYTPFKKGLAHFLKAEKRPEILSDVITDMYEALEALSKIVIEKPKKDLYANATLFIKKINVSSAYKSILKAYINYAHKFRHGLKEGEEKPTVSISEVESFVYLTGLFIRLAIEKTKS